MKHEKNDDVINSLFVILKHLFFTEATAATWILLLLEYLSLHRHFVLQHRCGSTVQWNMCIETGMYKLHLRF